MTSTSPNSPMMKVPFVQKVIQFSSTSPKRTAILSKVSSAWEDTVCNFPHTWSPLRERQNILEHCLYAHPSEETFSELLSENKHFQESLWNKGELLYKAARIGAVGPIEALVAVGADPNQKAFIFMGANKYPLDLAIEGGHVPATQALIKAKATLKRKNFTSLLKLAARNRYVEIMKVLVDEGESIHRGRSSLLKLAARNRHVEIMKVLVDEGKSIHRGRSSLLHDAVCFRQEKVSTTLSSVVEIEKKDDFDKTSLDRAV